MPLINASDIKELEPLPAGWYEARFAKFENGESAKGDDKIDLQFEVTEVGEYEGRKLYRTHSLLPQALWALKNTCLALGSDPEDWVGEIDTDDIMGELIGADCRLKVSQSTYEGRITNRVDQVLGQTVAA